MRTVFLDADSIRNGTKVKKRVDRLAHRRPIPMDRGNRQSLPAVLYKLAAKLSDLFHDSRLQRIVLGLCVKTYLKQRQGLVFSQVKNAGILVRPPDMMTAHKMISFVGEASAWVANNPIRFFDNSKIRNVHYKRYKLHIFPGVTSVTEHKCEVDGATIDGPIQAAYNAPITVRFRRHDLNTVRAPFRCALLAVLASVASNAVAQTSFPMLNSLYPCGLQRGKTVEVTLSGLHNYHSAYKVLIQGSGVTGEVVTPTGGWPAPDAKTGVLPVLNEIKLKLTAAADAPLGVKELRVATPRGVSTIGQIVVGDEPEVLEKEPNNDVAEAQEVALPVTINGRIQQGEDVDSYRFKAGAGETITFSVMCARLEDKTHDLQDHATPMITLRDMTGRELSSNEGYYRADPLLNYKFEKAGDYIVQVRDSRYQGNPHWVYRLNITKRPYVTALLPLTIHPGQAEDVRPVGFNLPGATAKLQAPASTPAGETLLTVQTTTGESNLVPVLVTNLPCSTAPDGMTEASPMAIAVPTAISGRLAKPGDKHRFKLHAKAGQMLTFEVEARRLYSRIDSVLTLYNAQGQEITSNDDAIGMDSRIDWVAPAEGDYQIELRDNHGGGGDNFVYVLEVKAAGPDFTLRCDDDKMRLGPGNCGAWYVIVDRNFGFNGEIKVDARGLPPGVTATPLTIPPNVAQGCLILTCAPDAKVGVGAVEVVGTSTIKGPDGKEMTLERIAKPLSEIYIPGGGRGLYKVDTQAVAVAEGYDILMDVKSSNVVLMPGGTARIDVTIKRSPGYKKAVNLDVYLRHLGSIYGNPMPPGVSLDEGASKTLLNENETQGHIVLKADANAQNVTNLPIAILGSVSINFVVKVSYCGQPVLLTVKKP